MSVPAAPDLAVEIAGETGDRVFLVHGSLDRRHAFRRVARRLRHLSVLSYDRRGYAGSLHVGAADGIERHVADLLAVLDQHGHADEPAIVVGHSMGGLIAITAAAHFPHRFRAVGAYEAPTGWAPWWPDELCVLPDEVPQDTVERFYRQMVSDAAWERLGDGLRDELLREGPALQIDLDAARRRAPFDPEHVTAPVLVAHGGETRPAYARAAMELVELLPTAELHVIDDAGHGAHRSHPDAFAAFVADVAGLAAVRDPGSG